MEQRIEATGSNVEEAVERALADTSAMVRLVAVQYLEAARPHTEAVLALLERACGDDNDKVRTIASRATWPFYRESPSIRDRQNTDRDIVVARTIPLPRDEWRFRLDPGQGDGARTSA